MDGLSVLIKQLFNDIIVKNQRYQFTIVVAYEKNENIKIITGVRLN